MHLTPEIVLRLIPLLEPFVTEHKRRLMQSVLDERTRWLTVALEDIYQPHNASAALRSCECFGVQDVHVIENRNRFRPSSDVAMGAAKWLNLHHYRGNNAGDSSPCIAALRQTGYRIVATALTPDATPLPDLSLEKPVALLFGTEDEGLSMAAMDEADERVRIPMFGFTRSFNVSVSVALCLHSLSTRLRASDRPWRLSDTERQSIYLTWLRRTIPHADAHIRRLDREIPGGNPAQ